MKKEIKFSKQELEKLKKLQTDYLDIQSKFGQISIARINLNSQLEDLDKLDDEIQDEFQIARETEKQLVDELTEKYGQGSLDAKTGVFTPSN